MVHADGSIFQTWDYLKQHGLQGFIELWPRPTATAWKIIACYGAFEAALQLLLPGKRVEGPISPTGNRPVYKVLDTRFLYVKTLLPKWLCKHRVPNLYLMQTQVICLECFTTCLLQVSRFSKLYNFFSASGLALGHVFAIFPAICSIWLCMY